MMDFNAYVSEPAFVAETIPLTISAPVPNWLSKIRSPAEYQRSIEYAKNHREQIRYTENGSQGMPVLRTDIYLEYRTREDGVELAEGSCYKLDMVARVAGAWGPDCVIEKFTKLPKNGLPKVEGTNLYLYTPTRARTEEARFILSNGAGRKCEVIVTFHRPRVGSGREEGNAPDVMAPGKIGKIEPGPFNRQPAGGHAAGRRPAGARPAGTGIRYRWRCADDYGRRARTREID